MPTHNIYKVLRAICRIKNQLYVRSNDKKMVIREIYNFDVFILFSKCKILAVCV